MFPESSDQPPSRPWRDIARELAKETNRERIAELAHELNRALSEQVHGRFDRQ